MAGTVIVQASTEKDLSEEESDRIRAEIKQAVKDYDLFDEIRTYYQEKNNITSLGFPVKTSLDELANNPGNARYLGIFIIGEEGDIISEKFISNPAINHDKGRVNLAFSVLEQNGVDRVLLRNDPNDVQTQILNEIDLAYETSPEPQLDDIRNRWAGGGS